MGEVTYDVGNLELKISDDKNDADKVLLSIFFCLSVLAACCCGCLRLLVRQHRMRMKSQEETHIYQLTGITGIPIVLSLPCRKTYREISSLDPPPYFEATFPPSRSKDAALEDPPPPYDEVVDVTTVPA
ncbi:unnamed protein product [Cyprideis torosa]|uniref:Uncharacterized protein n=1 Tax=Cyprideis torosa TaxID=163714 RepID=A0A7R8ZLC5_9CRUS|nr:unnamed protein product [Cyprideis torosa]CAG0886336.1 unnamed protein product [Cyprideis torosa]